MTDRFYKDILYKSLIGYAYHEVLFDSNGKAYDYRFIEVNPSFELFTGLLAKDIIGKTVLEVMPEIVKDEIDWISFYADIAINNRRDSFEGYSGVFKSWYKVDVFSPKKNFFITIFSDITKNITEKGHLLELESVFSTVVKNAPIPIMIHSDDGRVLNISDTWSKITGYSKEEINTIEEWTKKAYGLNQKSVKDFVNKLYDLHEPQHDGEFKIKTKDNHEVLWDFYSTYIGNTVDNKRMAMSVAIDVTENRKNREDLIKERLLFETTLLSVGDGVITTNKKGEITLINKIAEQLTGWSKEEAIGKKVETVFSIYNEKNNRVRENIIEKVINSGIVHELANHTVLRSKDGTERPIADSAAPIILSNGEIIGAVLVFRDYTEKYNSQKEIEKLVKELQQTQLLLQASLNSPMDMIILAIDRNYNYLYFNQAHKAAMQYAYEKDVEIGMNLIDSISSKSDKIIAKKNYDLALSGESITTIQEYGEVQKSYYESFYNPIFDENHKIIGATAFARDISKRILTEKALENEKELAQEYLRIAGVMIIVLDKNGIVTMINKKGCEIIGLEENSIIGKNWFDSFIPKNNTKQIKEVFENVLHKNGELEEVYTNKIVNASGEERLILWYNSILYDSDENVIGVLSSGEDITAITETNEKLKESENRYRQLTDNLEAGIVVHASDTSIISFNKKAEQILGLGYKELSGETSNSSNFRFFRSDLKRLKNEDYPVNVILKNKSPIKKYIIGIEHIHDNKFIWVSVNGVPLFNEDGSIKEVVISFIDITYEKVKQDEITYLSNHDYLTDLYNRRFFVEKYKELDNLSYYPLAIMMADVNGLKIINDAFGHDIGDIALRRVSKVLRESCREQDYICRIGGDEFAIILPNVDEEILDDIKETIQIKSKKNGVENVSLSLAIGYEIKTENSKISLDEIMKYAENHMYRHKLSEGISVRNNAIKAILKTLTNKYTEERIHSAKVSQLCKMMGEEMNLRPDDIKELELAGMYHDIGKISIPDAVLNKVGKLTQEEFNTIKTHPEISYQILRAADEYSDLAIHALYHHERWDGLGYPAGKKGKDIPLFSRIICIVDAFEAMTAERVYKEKMSVDEAIEEIIHCSGTQFDKHLAKIFVEKVLLKKWHEIESK